MGMTIDEAQLQLSMQKFHVLGKDYEAIQVAIDTMRKYQKIEQILSDWINDDSVGMSDYWMGRIKEVLEDGNDD